MLKTKTTKEQRKFLIKYFCYNSRPCHDERMDISYFINLTPKAVKIWFQNERSRIKKEETIKNMEIKQKEYFSPNCNALCLTPTYENVELFERISPDYYIGAIQNGCEKNNYILKYFRNKSD
ncbi:hypothetical protein H312_00317 [Anncaliia algerae PRA339]|uniref:Homeobox domain-containing protein n=1 Tax=Anncaliia algerae PRA339 TaxID=1288291 RepID=A0A059F5L7_9MICR|nr:hypothetical protein H312_00317 [Anncaliia algerae PRA339]